MLLEDLIIHRAISWHRHLSIAADKCLASGWCLPLKWLSWKPRPFLSIHNSSSLLPLQLVMGQILCCFCHHSILKYFSTHLLLILPSPPPQSSLLSAPLDIEYWVGPGQRRNQEDAERRAARRERKSRERQIQNTATDPTGQHQAADWRVRVHVRRAPPMGGGALSWTLSQAVTLFTWAIDATVFVISPPPCSSHNFERSSYHKLPKYYPSFSLVWIFWRWSRPTYHMQKWESSICNIREKL